MSQFSEASSSMQISESTLYWGVWLLCIVLSINLIFMTYINCCSSCKTKPVRKYKFSKVKTIVSSEDDMQNLKDEI
eukprot:UN09570